MSTQYSRSQAQLNYLQLHQVWNELHSPYILPFNTPSQVDLVNQDQQYNTAVQQEDLKCKIVFTFILACFSAKVPFCAQN